MTPTGDLPAVPTAAPAAVPSGPADALPRRRSRKLRRVLPLLLLAVSTSGCGVPIFGFPTVHATVQSQRILDLWKYSCIAALAVGAFTLALILYAPFRWRKKSEELPRQVRYNLPIEVLYTVIPVVIIAGLFYYTARDENYVDKLMPAAQFQQADGVVVDVIGYRWNWKFEYPQSQYDVAVAGNQDNMPTLYLPVNRPVRFVETSKDVIHSFWIVDFLFKRDVIPGRVNQFELTPNRVGTYVGRCAELCGVYHDRMNFQVVVMNSPDFEKKVAELKASGNNALDGDANQTAVGDQGNSNSNLPNATTNTDPSIERSHTIGSSP